MLMAGFPLQYVTIYLLTGIGTGFLSGLLGIGGGILVVPALLYSFRLLHIVSSHIDMRVAVGTSLTIMIATTLSSVQAHRRHRIIPWNIYHKLWLGLIIGTSLGVWIARMIPTSWLKMCFGIFLVFAGTMLLVKRESIVEHSTPTLRIPHCMSTLIGLCSGLLGIGGGLLLVPYLRACNIRLQTIPALSAVCTLTCAIIGTICYMLIGLHEPLLPANSTGYVYWPAVLWITIPSLLTAPYGARLTYRLPVDYLRIFFGLFIFIAGIESILQYFRRIV